MTRWVAGLGLLGLVTAWGGLIALLTLPGTEGAGTLAQILAPATLIGAGLSLLCGLLHPRRGWTFLLVLGGGVFLGVFLLPMG